MASRKSPGASGQQPRYRVGTPNTEAETKVQCPVCRQGMVPLSVAASVKEALSHLNSDALDDESDEPKNGTQ
jgi:hypothetical protein